MSGSSSSARYVIQAVKEQMGRRSFYDVTVNVGNESFKSHRLFLSAASEVLRKRFDTDIQTKEVVVDDMAPLVFKQVLDFIYTGCNIINKENIMDIWRAAHQLDIKYLVERCENFLSCHLSEENLVEIYVSAKAMNNVKLLGLAWDRIVQNFDHFLQGEDLIRLDFEDMYRLVSLDSLQVSDEQLLIEQILRRFEFRKFSSMAESASDFEVLRASMYGSVTNGMKTSAVSGNKNTTEDAGQTTDKFPLQDEIAVPSLNDVLLRDECLTALLKASRIGLVSTHYLQELQENETIKSQPQAYDLIKQVLQYKIQPSRTGDYLPSYARYRNTSPMANVLIVIEGEQGETSENGVACNAIMLDGRVTSLATPPKSLSDSRAVAYGTDVFATNNSGIGSFFKFSPGSGDWKSLPDMLEKRVNHALVCHGRNIYAVGGDDNHTIERYDFGGGWKSVGKLKTKVSNVAATSLNNMILVFGTNVEPNHPDVEESEELTTIQCFHTTQNLVYDVYATMPGSAKNVVCLRHHNETFVLQESGALYKIGACTRDRVEVNFCGQVWDCGYKFSLLAAALVVDKLVVLASGLDPKLGHQWKTDKMEIFKSVEIVTTEKKSRSLLNSVIPDSRPSDAVKVCVKRNRWNRRLLKEETGRVLRRTIVFSGHWARRGIAVLVRAFGSWRWLRSRTTRLQFALLCLVVFFSTLILIYLSYIWLFRNPDPVREDFQEYENIDEGVWSHEDEDSWRYR